jgi:hypothetical protein
MKLTKYTLKKYFLPSLHYENSYYREKTIFNLKINFSTVYKITVCEKILLFHFGFCLTQKKIATET